MTDAHRAEESVLLHRDGRLARVTLNRPARRNSFDLAMLARFEDVMHELSRDDGTEVVLLTGAGTAFCAGTDLHELATLDARATMSVQRRTAELVERWYRLEQSTVAAFNGPAIGSGAVLGLASDLRVAADTCFATFPEVGFGIPLTWSGMAILADLVGADLAKRWLLLGERIPADELRDLRLVTEVVDPGRLAAAATGLAERLLATSAVGRSMTKRAARLAGPRFEAAANDSYLGALSVALRPAGDYLARDAR
ncbi:Enoyl-CoA hydratase/carnithine racemase [Micromonospora echinofusca]|uniref:Enoyl-CoA hydratase/carnithine racemase n=1 Tax=Micromonospora echinofusca TaxID=47858 RepID=A0A1C5GAT9_MICEH|nr:enoyl-CoA hydratase/isomerase family protein [Micromonospora echinofusca]SCG16662.1 Enoyl-CoA hydratase/carnithine racemase [Micromonospora echinofusca]